MRSGFKQAAGYSLIEALFVVTLLSFIFLFYLFSAKQKAQTSQIEKVSLQLQNIMQFATTYHIENHKWPSSANVAEELLGSNENDSAETKLAKIKTLIPYANLSLPYETEPPLNNDKDLRYTITLSLNSNDPANQISCAGDASSQTPPEENPQTTENPTPPDEEEPIKTARHLSNCYLEKIAALLPAASVSKVDNVKTLTIHVIRPKENVPDGYQVKGMEFFTVAYNDASIASNIKSNTFSCNQDATKNWNAFCVQAIHHYNRDSDRLTTDNHSNTVVTPLGGNNYQLSQYIPVASQVGLFNPSVGNPSGTYTEQSLLLTSNGSGYNCSVNTSAFANQDFTNQKTLVLGWNGLISASQKPTQYDENVTYTSANFDNIKSDPDPKVTYQNAAGTKIELLVIYGCCRGEACDALRPTN